MQISTKLNFVAKLIRVVFSYGNQSGISGEVLIRRNESPAIRPLCHFREGSIMLTHLEVNGFKNLLDFKIDFGPFTCLAGLNGIGKSNVLDAIKFLSELASKDLINAARSIRDSGKDSGDIKDIFYSKGDERIDRIFIAAEMIVPLSVTDDFKRTANASSTYLRYEIEIGLVDDNDFGGQKIEILTEKLNYIIKSDAVEKLRFDMSAKEFRDKVVINTKKGTAFISTTGENDEKAINLHQDGGARGQSKKIPARITPRTVVSNTNSIESPTVLAAKREMMSWTFLSLEPSAMRQSNSFTDKRTVSPHGGFLASTLYKVIQRDQSAASKIIKMMSEIIQVSAIKVDVDQAREVYTIYLKERSGSFIPARSLSDGTLRFLALCIMSLDSDSSGLLCFEEPENGIHPARMEAMQKLLKDFAVDPKEPVSEDNPLRQVIIATHSPVLVKIQDGEDLIFADSVKYKDPFSKVTSTLRCKAIPDAWRTKSKNYETVSMGAMLDYLTLPSGSNFQFDFSE